MACFKKTFPNNYITILILSLGVIYNYLSMCFHLLSFICFYAVSVVGVMVVVPECLN